MRIIGWDYPDIDRRARAAWPDFLSRWTWTWFVNLTFRVAVSEDLARHEALKWLRRIAANAGRVHYMAAWVIEPDSNGHHLHAFLALPNQPEIDGHLLERALRATVPLRGQTVFRQYDPQLAKTSYLAKTSALIVETICPHTGKCRRRGLCVLKAERSK